MLNHIRFVFHHNSHQLRDQNHDTRKEQALSLTFSQYEVCMYGLFSKKMSFPDWLLHCVTHKGALAMTTATTTRTSSLDVNSCYCNRFATIPSILT